MSTEQTTEQTIEVPAPTAQPQMKFSHGTFNVVEPAATYDLPVVELVENKIQLKGAARFQFVRNEKTSKQFVLLGLFDKAEGGYEWGYRDLTDFDPTLDINTAPLVTHQEGDEALIKVKATLNGTGTYNLDIVEDGKAVDVTINPDQVLFGSSTKHTKTELESGVLQAEAYIYAVELELVTPAQPGYIIESVLDLLVFDLEAKYQELPSNDTLEAIKKLKEAAMWLDRRTNDRTKRGVATTNKV